MPGLGSDLPRGHSQLPPAPETRRYPATGSRSCAWATMMFAPFVSAPAPHLSLAASVLRCVCVQRKVLSTQQRLSPLRWIVRESRDHHLPAHTRWCDDDQAPCTCKFREERLFPLDVLLLSTHVSVSELSPSSLLVHRLNVSVPSVISHRAKHNCDSARDASTQVLYGVHSAGKG